MPTHLVLDLETDSFDVNKARVKFFGLYNIDTDEYIIETDIRKVGNIIKNTDFIITYNGKEYDLPILYNRFGIRIPYDKHIDLYQIFKKRQSVITTKPFPNFKLDTIARELKIDDRGKEHIDYNLFKKDSWTQEELDEIYKYLKQDLKLTSLLWEYLKKRFKPFQEFMNQKDIDNYKWVNTSMGAYTYKVVCNLCNIKEEYNFESENNGYEGAYVQIPKKEAVRGNILCFDFASLYPMMYVHANLFSHSCNCCTPEEKWNGNGNFEVKGTYCRKNQGQIEQLIKKLYLLRQQYKRDKDEREYVIKIIVNSLYGVSGSPIFTSLYNLNTAQDCTSLARQCIKYAIAEFEKRGFIALYTDTDSVYVEVPNNKTEEECINVSKNITKDLSNKFPFPWEEFNFKLECKIKYITFFRDENSDLKKKHYIYVTEDGKVVIKGLQIIKKDSSELSRFIFKKYILDNIKNNLICKYDKKQVLEWLYKELTMNKKLGAKQFSVKSQDNYKNTTSIQSMISEKYGEGEHLMIKNKRFGVGKGVKYCTIEESRELQIYDFDIAGFVAELDPFINKESNKDLSFYF